eukprot:gb/GECG01006267.1/.p1 GENE.gb/GECG01006267.1/~~gb/GECG01006267.1/.p1  ORF type:complete len:147 (+),score=6.57 gb/GECG01006267.1/:1-441(+)
MTRFLTWIKAAGAINMLLWRIKFVDPVAMALLPMVRKRVVNHIVSQRCPDSMILIADRAPTTKFPTKQGHAATGKTILNLPCRKMKPADPVEVVAFRHTRKPNVLKVKRSVPSARKIKFYSQKTVGRAGWLSSKLWPDGLPQMCIQ